MIFRFSSEYFLGFLLILPILVFWKFQWLKKKGRKERGGIRYSDIHIARKIKPSFKTRLLPVLFAFRLLSLALIICALARPQAGNRSQEISTFGVDIMLCVDVSGSMQFVDFQPHNRLYVSKEVIEGFIRKRKNDRIGLTIFAGQTFLQCPLTLDYGVLINLLRNIEIGMVEDGTAIGNGLANGVNRLRDSKAKNKVVILLTDGVNNKGEIAPLAAAQAAKALDIKVYTIAVGIEGMVMMPVDDPFFGRRLIPQPSEIDEKTLQEIAQITRGQFYHAHNKTELERIYGDIDRLEKTEIKVKEFIKYQELFLWFLYPALLFFLCEIIFSHTFFRRIP